MAIYIKNGATAEYIQTDNSMNNTARFIAENEGKEIFFHKIDDQNDQKIWISEYEKSTMHLIPITCVEEKIESENEEIQQENIIEEKPTLYKYQKKHIIGVIVILITITGVILINKYTTPIKEEKTIIEKVEEKEPDMFEIYTNREANINKKIDMELRKQKELRSEIEKSIESVIDYRNQKNEIMKLKIDLAQ